MDLERFPCDIIVNEIKERECILYTNRDFTVCEIVTKPL